MNGKWIFARLITDTQMTFLVVSENGRSFLIVMYVWYYFWLLISANVSKKWKVPQKISLWWMNYFVIWLPNGRYLALLPATAIARDPYHCDLWHATGCESVKHLNLGLVEWSCAVLITTTLKLDQGKKTNRSYWISRCIQM